MRLYLFFPLMMLSLSCSVTSQHSGSTPKVLRLKGSDTMLYLGLKWSEAFMRRHPGTSVYVEGGGTASGVRAMVRGDAEFCMASRPLTPEEMNELAVSHQSLGYSVLTARDALSFYTNEHNPVRAVTLDQIRRIFGGSLTRWSELGGPDAPIRVLRRNSNSGTHYFFEEHVLMGETITEDAIVSATTRAMVAEIARDTFAIGYGGLAYGIEVYGLSIDGVAPHAENVRNGTYPISRYLYLYSPVPPEGAAREFSMWVLSEEGQKMVAEVGYIPLYRVSNGDDPP